MTKNEQGKMPIENFIMIEKMVIMAHFLLTFFLERTCFVFKDNFLNVAQKELKYVYIREIIKKQTFVQRWFNIGNIIMYSNAESGYTSGIALVNVENINEVYKKVKEITYM